MTYYHCADPACGRTFQAEGARNCPCCGGRELRHALGREIDELERSRREPTPWRPVYALGA